MPHRTELEQMAQTRSAVEQSKFPVGFEQFKFMVWAVRLLLVGAIAAALWYARVEGKFTSYDRMTSEKVPEIAAHTAYMNSNDKVTTGLQNQLDSLRGRVTINEKKIEEMQPKVGEIWFLKDHGIDFSTEYYRKPGPKPSPP